MLSDVKLKIKKITNQKKMLRIQDSNKLQKINIKRESAKLNQMELYGRKQQM